MKKLLIICASVLLLLTACGKKANISAEKDEKKNRYVTVVNHTDQVINQVTLSADGGTEIQTIKNPDEKSFSIKIPKEYSDHSKFTVELIDRYEAVYQASLDFKETTGRKEIVVTEKHKTKNGHIISKFLNGD